MLHAATRTLHHGRSKQDFEFAVGKSRRAMLEDVGDHHTKIVALEKVWTWWRRLLPPSTWKKHAAITTSTSRPRHTTCPPKPKRIQATQKLHPWSNTNNRESHIPKRKIERATASEWALEESYFCSGHRRGRSHKQSRKLNRTTLD